jgi:hypothetical protein
MLGLVCAKVYGSDFTPENTFMLAHWEHGSGGIAFCFLSTFLHLL